MRNRIFLVFFGCILALCALETFFHFVTLYDLEGMFRRTIGDKLTDCLRRDPILHHSFYPSCSGVIKVKEYTVPLQTNSIGLRNPEVGNKHRGKIRVLIIGDSYAEGWGVAINDRFDTIARKILAKKGRNNIEIINAGIRNNSPLLELEYLYHHGILLHPDVVIQMYDVSSLYNDYQFGGWEKHKALLHEIFPQKHDDYVTEWPKDQTPDIVKFFMHSKLFSLVYSVVGTKILNSRQLITRTNLGTDVALFGRADLWNNFDKAFTLNIANILLTADYLHAKNIQFAFTVVPRGIYINNKEWEEGRKQLRLRVNTVYKPIPFTVLESAVKSHGVQIINLLQSFQKAKISPLVYSLDPHWTANGNRIAGMVIADFLEKWMSNNKIIQ